MKLKINEKAFQTMPVTVKGINKKNNTLRIVVSTQGMDRHGDTVMQSGWILSHFDRNPVILNSHNYGDATEVIARALSTQIHGVGADSYMEQEWKFACDENPKAKIIFDLYAGGFLNAASVGFIVRKFFQKDDGSLDYSMIEKAELLEVSAVSVPANAMALAKSKGINVDALTDKNYDDESKDNGDDDGTDDDEAGEEKPNPEVSDDSGNAAGDGNGGENGSGADDESGVGGEETTPKQPPKEEESKEPEPVEEKESKRMKIKNAIDSYAERRKSNITKAKAIIDSLVSENHVKTGSKDTDEKIFERKLNHAIRILIDSK